MNRTRPCSDQSSTLFRAHGLRYASTSPTPAPPLLPPPKAALDVPQELVKDDFFVDLTNVPVQIGYLKELGLDYGWGPTASMQSIIEYIHVFGDTPWWLSITLAIVGVRFGVVKLYINAADTSAKLAAIKPITDPITQLMKKAQLAGDQRGVMENRQNLSMIHSRADIKLWKAFLPLVQVFIGFGTFRLLRGMSSLPVPGFDTGGILWFHDLTMKDPFYALPISTAVLTLIVMKVRDTPLASR